MRDQSLTLRILLLAVLLLTVTAICVVALVVIGGLQPRIIHMATAGVTILIIAILASAISALGPKYRPTPLLTPLFAGVFAALLASTLIYAVQAHVAPKRGAVARVEAAPAPVAQPMATAPIVDTTSTDAPAAPLQPAMAPSFDADSFALAPAPSMPDGQPMASDAGQPPAMDAADGTAMDQPMVDTANGAATDQPMVDEANGATTDQPMDVANVAQPPADAAEKPAGDGKNKKAVVGAIPVPAVAPDAAAGPNRDVPLNLTAGFDPSGPVAPKADGPPMALDAADAAPARAAAIPPLPRIRPCGGAGPACP